MEHYEERLLAHLLKDEGAMDLLDGVVRKEHFSSSVLRSLFIIAHRVWQKTGKVPSMYELISLAKPYTDTGTYPFLVERVKEIYLHVIPCTQYEVSRILVLQGVQSSFLETQKWKPEDVDEGLETLREKLERLEPILSTQRELRPLGVEDFSEDTRYYGPPIPMGWPSINRLIRGGGMRRGEMAAFLAMTNTGKTMMGLDFSVRLVESGYRVLFISLDNLRGEVIDRLEARITGLSLDVDKDANEVRERVEQWFQRHPDQFFLVEAAPHQMSTSDVRRLLARLNRKTPIDVVVLDYASLLRPRHGKSDRRHELDMIFTDLKGIAKSEKVLMVPLVQANALSQKQSTLFTTNFAEGFSQSWHCNLGIGIHQTREERAMTPPRCRFVVVKLTKGSTMVEIPFFARYDLMRFDEDPEGKPIVTASGKVEVRKLPVREVENLEGPAKKPKKKKGVEEL
jgi:archaellum biogenesis ATPase FlaH